MGWEAIIRCDTHSSRRRSARPAHAGFADSVATGRFLCGILEAQTMIATSSRIDRVCVTQVPGLRADGRGHDGSGPSRPVALVRL